MQCGLCGSSGNQMDGAFRDLGGNDETFVCSQCQGKADEIAGDASGTGTESGIGGYSTIGSDSCDSANGTDSEPVSDSNGVTTKYAI